MMHLLAFWHCGKYDNSDPWFRRFFMRLEAYAKINWSLDIVGVREDSYHLMDMVMQPVSLADEITLVPSDKMQITTGGTIRSRADDSNLAIRAALLLREVSGTDAAVSIHVEKRIPIGAGLGGGSADAAAVLFGLNRLWRTGYTTAELEKIGLSLGADVPFCLRGGLTRTTGIGEIMENHPYKNNYWLLVFQPCRGLSTREIFTSWKQDQIVHPDTPAVLAALENGLPELLGQAIGNVLESVSEQRCPEIRNAKLALIDAGARTAAMTGSGSAVFGLFRSRESAEKAAAILSRNWKNIHLCHTQSDSIRILED